VKTIYAVLHGDKEFGPDPEMTPKGKAQIAELLHLLPQNPSNVIVGTGRRHHGVCKALGLKMTHSSPIIGDPTSLDVINGEKMLVFADGYRCPLSMDRSISDLSLAAMPFILMLEDNTVLCTGRPFLKALGWEEAQSGSVVLITVGEHEISFEVLESLGVTEPTK